MRSFFSVPQKSESRTSPELIASGLFDSWHSVEKGRDEFSTFEFCADYDPLIRAVAYFFVFVQDIEILGGKATKDKASYSAVFPGHCDWVITEVCWSTDESVASEYCRLSRKSSSQ